MKTEEREQLIEAVNRIETVITADLALRLNTYGTNTSTWLKALDHLCKARQYIIDMKFQEIESEK